MASWRSPIHRAQAEHLSPTMPRGERRIPSARVGKQKLFGIKKRCHAASKDTFRFTTQRNVSPCWREQMGDAQPDRSADMPPTRASSPNQRRDVLEADLAVLPIKRAFS
jgi:hypothetical protein